MYVLPNTAAHKQKAHLFLNLYNVGTQLIRLKFPLYRGTQLMEVKAATTCNHLYLRMDIMSDTCSEGEKLVPTRNIW